MQYARSTVVFAARAAGLPPPVQSVWTDLRDREGLRASCQEGKRFGFYGRSAVHPSQVAVIHDVYPDMPQRYAGILNDAARALSLSARVAPDQVRLDHGAIGAGYGEPTEQALQAIGLLMRTEGILCDYVYTGKALAALVADARAGRLAGPVVFWHSGGLPGIMTTSAMRILGGMQP